MARCQQCGNDYDKSFEVTMGGRTMIFDSFECAIQALAPTCPHCGCRIIGHGVETTALSSAVSIAPRRKASRVFAIGIDRGSSALMPPRSITARLVWMDPAT